MYVHYVHMHTYVYIIVIFCRDGACADESWHPWWWRYGMRLLIGRVLDDIVRMEEYIEVNCQDLDFVSVRPPGLANGPKAGACIE